MEYATLKLLWWFIAGILMTGYVIMDGYDLGVAGLLPFAGKTDSERRVMINTMAPHWDGNQVWLIALGGCIFAGWPQLYATSFSGFYFAMLLILFSLIVRPLALEYRAKVAPEHKKYCDAGLMAGAVLTPLLAGVAMGNMFTGFGFGFDAGLRPQISGILLDLLNPFGLMCGVLSLVMIWMQGALWLSLRTAGPVRDRSVRYARVFAVLVIVLFALGGVWVAHMPGFVITNIDVNGPANPLAKSVITQTGAWLDNYSRYPLAKVAPVAGFIGAFVALLSVRRWPGLAFTAGSVALGGIVITAGVSLFPFLMPSDTVPSASLTVWDAVSSYYTLSIAIPVAVVFLVVVVLYTLWCHYKMWRRLSVRDIERESTQLY